MSWEVLVYDGHAGDLKGLLTPAAAQTWLNFVEFDLTEKGSGQFALAATGGLPFTLTHNDRVDIYLDGTRVYSGFVTGVPAWKRKRLRQVYRGFGYSKWLDWVHCGRLTIQLQDPAYELAELVPPEAASKSPISSSTAGIPSAMDYSRPGTDNATWENVPLAQVLDNATTMGSAAGDPYRWLVNLERGIECVEETSEQSGPFTFWAEDVIGDFDPIETSELVRTVGVVRSPAASSGFSGTHVQVELSGADTATWGERGETVRWPIIASTAPEALVVADGMLGQLLEPQLQAQAVKFRWRGEVPQPRGRIIIKSRETGEELEFMLKRTRFRIERREITMQLDLGVTYPADILRTLARNQHKIDVLDSSF